MSTSIKIALAGGGSAKDSRPLDEIFAAWIGPQSKLLYWPFAMCGIRPYPDCLDWITATFAPLHITNISMWTELDGHRTSELAAFDAVYIGGGNTYFLLAHVRESGFDRALTAYALEGKPVYGGSAGAVLLGRDIQSVRHIDHNNVGLTETSGLNLAQDHAVWVHYQPQDDPLIEAYIRETSQQVLAISERSGIAVDADGLRTVGFEPAYRFDGQTKFAISGMLAS